MPRLGALEGVRILDFSQAHAGPYGSQILGDLGAEVIKIEPPDVGDKSRALTPQIAEGQSTLILACNRNKESLELNLRTKTGRAAFYDLVKISDVVWGNLRHGVMERIGADYESLRKINPKIILCTLTAYGSSGPYQKYPAFDDNVQGVTGMISLSGEPGKPMRSPVAIADMAGGFFGAIAILAALYQREQTGAGCELTLNLADCCLSLLGSPLQSYFLTGKMPPPAGSKQPIVGIAGIYKTRNGFICLGPCWPRIARVINREHLIDDPRFSSFEKRYLHKDELNAAIEEGLSQANTEDWLELMHEEDIAASPMNNLEQALKDPQVIHNKMVINMHHPVYGEARAIDCPIRMVDDIEKPHQPPPTLGEHTEKLLTELLGYSKEKIMELKQEEKAADAELKRHIISPGL